MLRAFGKFQDGLKLLVITEFAVGILDRGTLWMRWKGRGGRIDGLNSCNQGGSILNSQFRLKGKTGAHEFVETLGN